LQQESSNVGRSSSSALSPDGFIYESEPKKPDKPLIVACIPAYNEEKSIGAVVLEVRKYVDDIFVCDDGSFDHTREIAEGVGATVVVHEVNKGKGAAKRSLINVVKKFNPDAVVFIDADGQHDPASIPNMVAPILSGEADFVIGSRFIDKGVSDAPFYRRMGLRFFNRTTDTSGKILDTQSGYRAFSPKMLDQILNTETNGFGIESETIALANQNGFRIKEIPITIKYAGVSKPSKKNPIAHGVEITSTLIRLVSEERPLLYIGVPSTIIFLLGLLTGIYMYLVYDRTAYMSIPWALVTIALLGLGTFMGTATLILYAISKLKKRT
jgi:glycosyltransferase involved in cell wall biosynthesis